MNIDTIRGSIAYFTAAAGYLIGLIALVALMFAGRVPVESGLPALIGLVGFPATFLFAAEVAKQASKQAERNILQQPPEPNVLRDPPPGI